ncbi:hypothetical protein KKA15_05030 [Patescibacteria group bacterium]|nr:hypothetical protein [Patescibacteria group bacterium]
MENQIFKKFTLWDSVVLLVLILIAIPSILGVLEAVTGQDYYQMTVYLFISAIILFGIFKYSKKLVSNIKNAETKKRATIISAVLIIITLLFFFRLFF